MSSQNKISLVSLTLVIAVALSACGPRFPSEGRIEKTVNGHTWVLAWSPGKSGSLGKCNLALNEQGTINLHMEFLPERCSAEVIVSKLEELKKNAPSATEPWGLEMFDQLIAGVKESE